MEGWRKIEDLGPLTLTGFYPLDTFAESGLLLLLYNFGLPGVATVIFFHVLTLRACHRILRNKEMHAVSVRALAGATEGLTVGVLLGSINLPIVIIPPVYLFVAILSAIVMQRGAKQAWRPVHAALPA